jgi:ParB-like chromosome segregation protein Spo0J
VTIKPKSWRDILPIHPAAELFPMMSADELRTLGEDIKATGLKSPIAITAKNVGGRREYALLDGRNRLDAMELAGIEFALVLKKGHCYFSIKSILPHVDCTDFPDALEIDDGAAYAYVISANIHRRHLTAEQRQEKLIQLIAAAPQRSDRQIGKATGVDHKTIARARAKGEDVGRIPHVETRTDSKGRAQPAHKSTSPPSADHIRPQLQTWFWTEDQFQRKERAARGECVVANMRVIDGKRRDDALLNWAESENCLVRIDRATAFGNPFEMPDDGERAEVVEKFEKHYWPYKNALQAQVPTLKGKVLMCWCYPEQCHGDVIAEAANRFVACEEAVP